MAHHDEEFYRKLLERLVLRFQGSFDYLGNVRGYAGWSETAQQLHARHDNAAVRAMIQMIAHAVVEEVKTMENNSPLPVEVVMAIRGAISHLESCEDNKIHHPFKSSSLPLLRRALYLFGSEKPFGGA